MLITDIIATLLVIASGGFVAMLVSRFIHLPLNLLILFMGMIAAVIIPISGFDTGIRAENFQTLIMFVLLPLLVFEAALEINLSVLRPLLAPVLYASTIGLAIMMAIAAAIIYWLFDHPSGFPVIAALLTGLVISATDPAAVVSQLREANAPEKLSTLIEGESLFNDASAIVLYGILLAVAMGHTQPTPGSILSELTYVLVGGALIGMVLGFVMAQLMKLTSSIEASSFVSALLVTYGSFYFAEHILHVSGVVAVLLAGLTVNHFAADACSRLRHQWHPMANVANIIVFFLMGLVVTYDMFSEQWLAILIGVLAAFVSRFIGSYLTMAVGRWVLRTPLPFTYTPVMIWGGLRGVVTLALVLSLPIELPYWWTIQSIGFGVVLFTLLVQAPSNSWLIRRLSPF